MLHFRARVVVNLALLAALVVQSCATVHWPGAQSTITVGTDSHTSVTPNAWLDDLAQATYAHNEPFSVFGIAPGFNIHLYPNDVVTDIARTRGFYGQLRLVELLLRDAHSGLVVDVGAHLGFVTLYAASLGHRVIGLEPQSELYHMALASRGANPRISNRVQLFRAAAHWDTGRMHTLSFEFAERRGGQRTSGLGTLAPVDSATPYPTEAVPAARVDDLVGPDEHVHLLKVCATACQCHALRSAERILSTGRVHQLMLRVRPKERCGCNHTASMQWLMSIGFEPHVVADGQLVAISPNDLLHSSSHPLVVFTNTDAFVERPFVAMSGSWLPSVCSAPSHTPGNAPTEVVRLKDAGEITRAVELAEEVADCHPNTHQAASVLAFAAEVRVANGQHDAVMHRVQQFLDATEPVFTQTLSTCERRHCFNHVYGHLRARGELHSVLATALHATGRVHEAVAALKRATSLHGSDSVHEQLATLTGQGWPPWEDRVPPASSPGSKAFRRRPLCDGTLGRRVPERDYCLQPGVVTVVLSVYKRDNLRVQLDAVLRQTLRPVAIYVWQNGRHVDVTETVAWYNEQRDRGNATLGDIPPLKHIWSEHNFVYLGRFMPLIMMSSEYSSVWDDDVVPMDRWLEQAVATSRDFDDAVVGANGRLFLHVGPYGFVRQEALGDGQRQFNTTQVVDFVGHMWLMRTDYVRLLFGTESPLLTFTTGEDVQLGVALQRFGIQSVVMPPSVEDETYVADHNHQVNAGMFNITQQLVRHRTFCQAMQAGLVPHACDGTCVDARALRECVRWANNAIELYQPE